MGQLLRRISWGAEGLEDPAGPRAEFGAALIELRQGRGLTQEGLGEELAKRAYLELGRRGVQPTSRQTIYRWETGQCWPDSLNGYLLCRLFEKSPEDLCLHRVLTAEVLARFERTKSQVGQLVASSRQADVAGHQGLDWERLGFVMSAMRQADPVAVEDQWTLTRRYLDDRRRMRGRTLLDLMVDHIVRLRQLRCRTVDERLRRELTIMLGETLVAAGGTWIGLTDFGMAVSAYREAAELGKELGEDWLHATALLSLAQLGGVHAIAPWSPAARLALMEETKRSAVASAQVRVWLHATRAQIHAILGQHAEAQRSLELADRAQALVSPGSGYYFALVDPVYLPVQRASSTLLGGHPKEAVGMFDRIAESVDPRDVPIKTWVAVYVAAALAAAGDLVRAAPALREAQQLAQKIDSALLEHSVERIATRGPWAAELSPTGGQDAGLPGFE